MNLWLESAKFHHFGRFCFVVPVFVLHWRFARSAFPPTTREKGKKKSAGAEKKERPPERATFVYQIFEKLSATPTGQLMFLARSEEDTEARW